MFTIGISISKKYHTDIFFFVKNDEIWLGMIDMSANFTNFAR